jgi:pimeloyl-ACP methyl ester carboxylesterase
MKQKRPVVPTTGFGALAEVRRTAEAKPGMKVVEIDGAGHVETLSRKEFVAAIRAFLAAQR